MCHGDNRGTQCNANKLMKIDVTHTRERARAQVSVSIDPYACARRARSYQLFINSNKIPTQDNGSAMCVCVCECVSVECGMLTMTTRRTSFPRPRNANDFPILMKHRVRRLIRYLRRRRMDAPFGISCCNVDWTESLTEWWAGRLQTTSKRIVNFWNNYNRVSYQRRCN